MQERISLMTFTMDIDVAMRKLTVLEMLTLAKEAGLRHLDIMVSSQKQLAAYEDALRKTGMQAGCLIGTVSFFSNSEEKILKTLQGYLQDTARIKAPLCMIVPVDTQKDEKLCRKLGKEEIRRRLVKYFTAAVHMAKELGVKACFETTPRDYTCLSGIEDCRWVLEQVPGLGLVYDTANMLSHGDDPLDYYEALKPYILHVHLKDVSLSKPSFKDKLFHAEQTKAGQVMQCCVSGQGVIPLKEIAERMEKDGYVGLYALEYSHPNRYPANKEQHVKRLKSHMDFWKQV